MSSAEKTNCFSHKSDQEPTSNEFVFTHEILECAFSDWLLVAESSYFPTNSRRAARCDNSALAMYPMNNVFVVWMCTNQCSHDTVVVCASSYASICDVCGSHSTVASPSICMCCMYGRVSTRSHFQPEPYSSHDELEYHITHTPGTQEWAAYIQTRYTHQTPALGYAYSSLNNTRQYFCFIISII